MSNFYCPFFLLVFFFVQSDCGDDTVISAYVYEDVSLVCFHPKFMENQSCTRVKWTKYLSNGFSSKIVLVRPETPEFPDAQNIKWETKDNGQRFLLLSDIKKSDEGVYNCEIWSGWKLLLTKNFTLRVKECPSKMQIEPLGSPVTLNCSESKGAGVQNLSWSLLKGGHSVPVPKRFQVNGPILSIKSPLVTDSEWYRCEYRFEDTWRCFDIKLLLQEYTTKVPKDKQTFQVPNRNVEQGFTVVHNCVTAVSVGVMVTAALVGAVLYWKYNKKATQEPPEYQEPSEYQEIPEYHEVSLFHQTPEHKDFVE